MLREAHIPILLWLPAAVLIHLASGGSATEVARSVAEKAAILRFSRGVRAQISRSVTGEGEPTMVEVIDELEPLATEAEPDARQDEPEPVAEAEVADRKPPVPTAEAKPKPEPAKEQAILAPPAPAKPLEQKPTHLPEPPKEQETKPDEGPKPPLELPRSDGRIAVQNDPSVAQDQPDNPNAPRIADHANKTDNETQAAIRSYDQNAAKPTGGGKAQPSAHEEPGNADEHARGHSIEAPSDGPPRPGSEAGPDHEREPIARDNAAPEQRIGQAPIASENAIAPRDAGKGPELPEAVTSDGGSYSLDPDGGDGRPQRQARNGRKGRKGQVGMDGLILPGKLPARYTMDAFGLQRTLGADRLRAEQEQARNVRLNKHRGSFKGLDFSKYRAAIENYDPAVKEGNQTSLNAARVPFASYINRMHNRIHPIFADGFLASLANHPDQRLANMKLLSHLELVLDGSSGKLIAAGVVKASGVTALEVAALRAVEEASPYGKPPEAIRSPDGRIYLHWEFYRDPYYACTSKFARPYLLKGKPRPTDADPLPTPPPPQPPLDGDSPKYGSRR